MDHSRDGEEWLSKKYAEIELQQGIRNISMAKKHGYEGRNVQGGSGSEILYKDSEGVSVLRGVAECLNGTTIVDKNGNFLAVYHSTDKDFSEFKKGDINWSTS